MKYLSKSIILVLILGLGTACSMNPHRKYVQENHKNSWLEKEHIYRSLASIGEPTGNPSGAAIPGERNHLSQK